LAAGAIYALVGVTYNTMFSTSRVMSFYRRPARHARRRVRFDVHAEDGHADLGRLPADAARMRDHWVITEFVAVRPVLKASTSIFMCSPRWRWR